MRTSAHRADVLHAADVLDAWDRTAAVDSRGGVLFKRWIGAYQRVVGRNGLYREPWTPERPLATPAGLGSPDAAITALTEVVMGMRAEGLALDTRWGDVHRVIRGHVDEPVAATTIRHAVALLEVDPVAQTITVGNPLYGRQVKAFDELDGYWLGEAVLVQREADESR